MISGLTCESQFELTGRRASLTVRKAAMHDIAPLLELINGYAARGIMLPRAEFELSENMRDFSVVYDGNTLAGCGALHFYSPLVGEIRSLAVAEESKIKGIGRLLVEHLVQEAQSFQLAAVFAFTYVPGFFQKVHFQQVERGELPLKAWKDCLRCPKFQACDEIAMVRVLDASRWALQSALPPSDPFVLLPTLKIAR